MLQNVHFCLERGVCSRHFNVHGLDRFLSIEASLMQLGTHALVITLRLFPCLPRLGPCARCTLRHQTGGSKSESRMRTARQVNHKKHTCCSAFSSAFIEAMSASRSPHSCSRFACTSLSARSFSTKLASACAIPAVELSRVSMSRGCQPNGALHLP